MDITNRLFSLQDLGYRDFHAKLMPTVSKEKIIGIRTPVLRSFAKTIKDTEQANILLKDLPHFYYEENNLHGMLIEYITDANEQAKALDEFLPFVDNWATCDLLRPKALFKKPDLLLKKIDVWLKSDKPYVVRFAIGMLLVRFLDEDFSPEYLKKVAEIKSDDYYVKMMQAWYFATALAKQYTFTVEYLLENKLELWVHNKTIRKARESYRIDDDKKAFLLSLKRHS